MFFQFSCTNPFQIQKSHLRRKKLCLYVRERRQKETAPIAKIQKLNKNTRENETIKFKCHTILKLIAPSRKSTKNEFISEKKLYDFSIQQKPNFFKTRNRTKIEFLFCLGLKQ